jgi:hypothetical protein
MARRALLNEDERRRLFCVPPNRDELVRLYTLSRADLELVLARRGHANRLGFAVQLALLRHPGFGLTLSERAEPALVAYMAEQLDIEPRVFAAYARRVPTASEHARELEQALRLRPSTKADLTMMIEAAAQAAWPTDKGRAIAEGVIAGVRAAGIILPPPDTIERVGLAGRARARTQAAEALLENMSEEGFRRLDTLLIVDPETGRAPLTWLKDLPTAPKADHVREILDRLHTVRAVGLDHRAAGRIHSNRLALLVREGRSTPAYAIERYQPVRRRAILVALLLDLEQRLTDAALAMADRLIGASFTRGKNAKERSYSATSREVGNLMRLLEHTAGAVEAAVMTRSDVLAEIEKAVGLNRLFGAKPKAAAIADLTEEDPLVRAAERWKTLRRYGPMLLDAIDFKANRADDRTIAAVNALRELNRSGSREVPKGTPMPFRKDWKKLIVDAMARSTASCSRRRCSLTCATNGARATCGWNDRRATAASTATCC